MGYGKCEEVALTVHFKISIGMRKILHMYSSFEMKFVYISFSIKLQQVIKCESTILQTKIHIIHTTLEPSLLRKKKRTEK